MKWMDKMLGRRLVRLEAVGELSEAELARALANQGESSVVRAIAQVIDDECMAELNASLDQSQSERVCAAAAGGAQALLALKARLAGYLQPVLPRDEKEDEP
jgi:hypothetical protein